MKKYIFSFNETYSRGIFGDYRKRLVDIITAKTRKDAVEKLKNRYENITSIKLIKIEVE